MSVHAVAALHVWHPSSRGLSLAQVPAPASSTARWGGHHKCSLGLRTYLFLRPWYHPSILDGELPKWTEWLSSAATKGCGFEEMNIQEPALCKQSRERASRGLHCRRSRAGSDPAVVPPRSVLMSTGCWAPESFLSWSSQAQRRHR